MGRITIKRTTKKRKFRKSKQKRCSECGKYKK